MNAPKSWDDVNQTSHLTWPDQIARIRAEYEARIAALEAGKAKAEAELATARELIALLEGEQARADKAEAAMAEAVEAVGRLADRMDSEWSYNAGNAVRATLDRIKEVKDNG